MSPAIRWHGPKYHINGRLYLDDMAPGTSEVDLRSYFGRYGDVADIFIPTYGINGQPRCCAFVHFSNPGDGGRALAEPHHVINGQEVRMSVRNFFLFPVLLHFTSENAESIFGEILLPHNE